MNPLQDVFISYGRADSLGFAAKLNQRLVEAGLEVWFDFDDIPLGVDYQKQIDDGIDKADNFVFVIAPHSINSPYCGLEVERALQRNKRIFPILHVEEISRETWQERNPNGTDAQWEEYCAAGKHSSFPNMHPAIGKINWVYCREGADDFEKAFQDLLSLFQRNRDYVHQHTALLNRALEWDSNSRQPQHLLVDETLQASTAWLKTQFGDRQPPCLPTKLHGEFIAESLKYSQDGMTEIFLCHAASDQDILGKVDEAISRAGLTAWSSERDIKSGVDFQDAIKQGIETTDNVVYLLSAESVKSSYCQFEIDYALSLNKRIIPVLIESIDLKTIHPGIQKLQFIDLTPLAEGKDGTVAMGELLKTIQQEADYFKTYKRLLVKALRWERQLQNPSILLRGHELQRYAAWQQVAQKRSQHQPLPLQTEYIETSLKQPPDVELNVFIISHARDLDFARKLNETLQVQGERTWFEGDRTELGDEYLSLATAGIERAENVVFVVSEVALTDTTVLNEIEIAAARSKRIVAVSYQESGWALVEQLQGKTTAPEEPNKPAAASPLPTALRNCYAVDFCEHDGDFVANFGNLYRLIKSHPDYVREHTQLLMRATNWEQTDRDDSSLLRAKEVVKAESWLVDAEKLSPPPAELHKTYIQASHELSARKVKWRSLFGVSGGMTFLIFMARIFLLLQGAELWAYDHFLRQRPNEEPDDRFLVVTIDDSSGSYLRDGLVSGEYKPWLGTLPDDALAEVLDVLNENGARLIGLDFYRDFPAANSDLANTLASSDNFLGVCKLTGDGESSVQKPPEVDISQVSFANMLGDRPGGIDYLRRQYLMDYSDPPDCETNTSLSLTLAKEYLKQEGLEFTSPAKSEGGFRMNGLQFGDTVIPNISQARGPYYQYDGTLNGYQTLVNFRTAPNLEQPSKKDVEHFADQVTLEALLENQVPQEQIADRIVLIGYTDQADNNTDIWDTPYGSVSGVFLQGQMASQLISATLDERALISWWSLGEELLWILAWAIVGGTLSRQLIRGERLGGGLMISMVLLYSSCWIAMIYAALWISFIPPLLALNLSAGGVGILSYRLRNP
ncbi:putative Chase2 sensor protein [[Leptolyngbya] sp. PCC 7376]|uniref:TIR domain-containing protein n=1 Tax=[Leptolyngbya] sp. PCC 7376 TaxID=111781 RepID=UPI00029F0D0A|nr:TIR domain-containing protein [[Leptolyngbya] sp. PCC 7376]AFY38534.1 putative Chase2 sensor protein [[Leptolyngbya] sp. PCC 7376]